jgi:uncharacterized protein
MKRTLTIGSATAASGSRADGRIDVSKRPGGGDLTMPVIVLNGAEDGPVLWVNGGIHGDEPEGPLAIQMLLGRIEPARLRGALVCVPVVNVAAFEAQQRGNPADGFTYDMNRVYPGKPDGYPSERVAHAHYRAMIDVADLEISIHSGGAHSYLAQALFFGHAGPSLELAQAMGPGWDLFLKAMSTSGSPMAAMANAGKAALTVELGGICATLPEPFLANGRALADALENVLRHYDMIDGEAAYAERWHVGVQRTVLCGIGGFFVPEAGIAYRTPIAKGTKLAEIRDLYGRVLEEVVAPADGQVFGMRTMPCCLPGDWACFFGEVQETLTERSGSR